MPEERRTQAERREATRSRLIEAAVESLVEVGYAATSAKSVLDRAGLSVGGLYAHFPAMHDLIIAAAEDVRARQSEDFRAGLAMLGSISEEECIELLRATCRKRKNGVWYELLIAARTDAALREQLLPFTEQFHREILTFARSLPVAEGWEPDAYAVAIMSLVHLLDAEAIIAVVLGQAQNERSRTKVLAAFMRGEMVAGALSFADDQMLDAI